MTVIRHVSSLAPVDKVDHSRRSSKSYRRKAQSQSTKSIRKRCRIRAGRRHDWISRTELPSRSVLAIHEIVQGPFSSPRLVNASPYVLVSSNCKKVEAETCKSVTRCPRVKRGIPDPWAEYLAYRGYCSKNDQRIIHQDLKLGCKNIYVTARVWQELGLPLGQGIPDPWKLPLVENKWISENRIKPAYGGCNERDKHRYCRYCKRCARILSSDGSRRVDRASVHVDPSPLNPPLEQDTQYGTLPRQETLQYCTNSARQVIRNLQYCTAPCDSNHNRQCSIDDLSKHPNITNRSSVCSSLTPSGKLDDICMSRKGFRRSKTDQSEAIGRKASRATRTSRNLIDSAVQTSEMATAHALQTKANCGLNKDVTCPCVCDYEGQFSVLDTACAYGGNDPRKKRVGFGTEISPCIEQASNAGKQSLNVTQLPCGCVHVSPCSVTQGLPRAENRYTDSRLRGCDGSPGNDGHEKTVSEKYNDEHLARKSSESKPKMISKMKRLLNRYKPESKSRNDHESSKIRSTKSETRVPEVPEDGKFVCCQCSCPYLKIRKSPQAMPTKAVTKKKRKCACGRCIAKREKRERRRNAATDKKEVTTDSKSGNRRVQVEPDQQITVKCENEICGSKYRTAVIFEKEQAGLPATQNDMIDNREISEKLTTDVNSLETWRYPATFGAPWYSSDSGENADVSETSRHTLHCTPAIKTSLETAIVTSCTFINRIDHSTVLQCLNRQQRRGDRDAEEVESTAFVSQNYPRRCEPKTSTLTNGSCNAKSIANEIPLLDIEELDTKNSSRLSPKLANTTSPVCFGSSQNYEKLSGTPPTTASDKNRRDSCANRTNTRMKGMIEKPAISTVDRSQITSDVGSITKSVPSSSQRTYVPSSKTVPVLDEIRSAKHVVMDQIKIPESSKKISEFEGSVSPDNTYDSYEDTQSFFTNVKNFGHDPVVTTIVSARKMSTNSSITCVPENCTRKCGIVQVPRNTSTDGGSSEDQRLLSGGRNSTVHRNEMPFTQVPCFESSSDRSNSTEKDDTLAARYAICSPPRVGAIIEGEELENCDSNDSGQTEPEISRKIVEGVRILVPNEVYQGVANNTSIDKKCYLKYCSQRSSGPCVVSTGDNTLRMQHPLCINDGYRENAAVLGVAQSEFPPRRKTLASSNNQTLPAVLAGDVFPTASPHPPTQVQDKFNIG